MINTEAPVSASSEIGISANIENVWEVMTAINRWPIWNPDVKSVSMDGEVAEGIRFRWKAGPGRITSVIQHIERPRLLIWTGQTLGVKALHIWRLESQEGKTVVRSEESWDGLLVRIFHGAMQKTLKTSLDAGLRYLKVEAERISKVVLECVGI